jgi:prepilin-type N-terminal cleavage/methylation domain-containing protein
MECETRKNNSAVRVSKRMEHGSNSKRGRGGFTLLELLIVMAVVIVVAGMAIPKVMTMVNNMRTEGDAENLNSAILLAKMRAGADFARARVYADLSANTYHIEVFTSGDTQWRAEGGTQYLSNNATFGYGSLSIPPTGAASVAQAPACLENDMVASNTYSNTACVMFNSRGIPVDNTMAATTNDALYITNGTTVTGVVVSATGLTKIWRTGSSTAVWEQR